VKRLILLRHAKSSWDQPELPDTERPLSKRGELSAPLMGQLIAREGYVPTCILCSSAKRAVQTGQYILDAFSEKPDYRELDELYMATPREILVTIDEQAGDAQSILVIGHNPGLGDLADWLLADGKGKDIARLKDKFPTAAVAVIDLPIDSWHDLSDSTTVNWHGELVRFATPRDAQAEPAAVEPAVLQ
jgi:phosphohistidine phosphatase